MTSTHAQAALAVLQFCGNSPHDHLRRHMRAWTNPQGFEVALVRLFSGLIEYADRYRMIVSSAGLESDPVLGEPFRQIVEQVRALSTQGPTGRLDVDTLEALAASLLRGEGFGADAEDAGRAYVVCSICRRKEYRDGPRHDHPCE